MGKHLWYKFVFTEKENDSQLVYVFRAYLLTIKMCSFATSEFFLDNFFLDICVGLILIKS